MIAAGVVVTLVRDWSSPPSSWTPRPLAWLLAAFVVLYAVQTLYSGDFSKGLQNVCFFLVPFTVAYRLLREVEWDRRLLTLVLIVVGVEAAAFVLIGSVEYLTRSLFWNDQVIRSNEFHTYFRVNSVFWDPNVYGRYLALVIVVATAALLWARERRAFAAADGPGRGPLAGPGADLLAVELHRPAGGPGGPRRDPLELAVDAGGRPRRPGRSGAGGDPGRRLGQGQLLPHQHRHQRPRQPRLRRPRPLRRTPAPGLRLRLLPGRLPRPPRERGRPGLGLPHRADHHRGRAGPPRPTALRRTHRRRPLDPGLGHPRTSRGGADRESENGASLPRPRDSPSATLAGRSAVLAAFVALLVHTMAYAGFFEDPITWVLLAVGASLAAAPTVRDPA